MHVRCVYVCSAKPLVALQSIRHGDAICDSAFMSTSKAINVAMTGNYGGQTLCVIRGRKNRDGFLRSGADVCAPGAGPGRRGKGAAVGLATALRLVGGSGRVVDASTRISRQIATN